MDFLEQFVVPHLVEAERPQREDDAVTSGSGLRVG
jgi:hypothetical protein